MFDDEKIRIIESMPDADSLIVIWVKLLCQAGKTYAGGYICLHEEVPYTAEELASVLSRPLNTVKLAIETFRRLEMIEVNEKGIFLINFPKHQNIPAIEESRKKARLRQAKHRKLLSMPEAVTRDSRNSHTNVTPLEEDNRDKKKNKKKNKDNPPIVPPKSAQSPSLLNINLIYEQNIEPLTPLIKNELVRLGKDYPGLWIRDAIKEAVVQNERRMSYIKGILRNWGEEGHDTR